jgi:hypothetical protein
LRIGESISALCVVLRGRHKIGFGSKFKPSVERYDEEKAAQCKREPVEIQGVTQNAFIPMNSNCPPKV